MEKVIHNLDEFINDFHYDDNNLTYRYISTLYEITAHYQFLEVYLYGIYCSTKSIPFSIEKYCKIEYGSVWTMFYSSAKEVGAQLSKADWEKISDYHLERTHAAHVSSGAFRFYRPFLDEQKHSSDEICQIEINNLRSYLSSVKDFPNKLDYSGNGQIVMLYREELNALLNFSNDINNRIKTTVGKIIFLSTLLETYFEDMFASLVDSSLTMSLDDFNDDCTIGNFIFAIKDNKDPVFQELAELLLKEISMDELQNIRKKRNFYVHKFFVKYLDAENCGKNLLVDSLLYEIEDDYIFLKEMTDKVESFLRRYITSVAYNAGELFPFNDEYFLPNDTIYRSFLVEEYFKNRDNPLQFSNKTIREKAIESGLTEWDLFKKYAEEIYEKLKKYRCEISFDEVKLNLWDLCNKNNIWFTDGRFVGDAKKHGNNIRKLEEYLRFFIETEINEAEIDEEKLFLHLMVKHETKNEIWQGKYDSAPKEIEKYRLLWEEYYNYENEDGFYTKEYCLAHPLPEYLRVYAVLKMIEIFYYSGFLLVEDDDNKLSSSLINIFYYNLTFRK